MTAGAVDLPVQATHAAVEAADSGDRSPPGKSDLGIALVFIAPALIGFLVFYLYPFIRGLYFSLTQYNVLGTPSSSASTTSSRSSRTRCSGTRCG